jgi:hypothetical protein
MKQADLKNEMTPSQRISEYIAEVTDWRGEMLARLRKLVHEAAPDVAEEWKWGSPVWSQNGNALQCQRFQGPRKNQLFQRRFSGGPKGPLQRRVGGESDACYRFH